MHSSSNLLCGLLVLLALTSLGAPQEERHSRVGDPRYWTRDCFQQCYKTYLRCVGTIFPPAQFNNEQMVRMFNDKDQDYHLRIEDCGDKYDKIIQIEEDKRRSQELARLNETVGLKNNFDLCAFTQCGAGGYYGSFNKNYMQYSSILAVIRKQLDPEFDFYFEMNSV